MQTWQNLVRMLSLEPHPEGGFYREIYRSAGQVVGQHLPEQFNGDRNLCTSIYFLLHGDQISHFHRIDADEIWHFYSGGTVLLHSISPEGALKTVRIGNHLEDPESVFQYVIPAGYWFAAELEKDDTYCLVGCTVSPGFDFSAFELAKSAELGAAHPEHQDLIERMSVT